MTKAGHREQTSGEERRFRAEAALEATRLGAEEQHRDRRRHHEDARLRH
jgi:hypothetical protein